MTEVLTYRPACSIQPYIAGIDFEIMTPEEIKKYSAVQVTSGNIYSRNVPAACGMSDIRMGTCDRNLRCGSCGNSVRQCPGHCGHIELPQPMFHMAYMDHVLKLLRCTCFVCGEVRGNPPEPTKDSKATFNATYLACKSRRVCAHCGVNTVQVSKSGSSFRATVAPSDNPDVHEVLNRPLNPANVLDIFGNIDRAGATVPWLGSRLGSADFGLQQNPGAAADCATQRHQRIKVARSR